MSGHNDICCSHLIRLCASGPIKNTFPSCFSGPMSIWDYNLLHTSNSHRSLTATRQYKWHYIFNRPFTGGCPSWKQDSNNNDIPCQSTLIIIFLSYFHVKSSVFYVFLFQRRCATFLTKPHTQTHTQMPMIGDIKTLPSGDRSNIRIQFWQYRNSLYEDYMVSPISNFRNGDPFIWKDLYIETRPWVRGNPIDMPTLFTISIKPSYTATLWLLYSNIPYLP